MEARTRARQPALLALAGAAALLGAAIVFFPGRALPAAFFGLFCIIAAAALAAPAVTVILLNGFARLSDRIPRRASGLGGRFAARSAIAGLSRTGPAVSALAVAIAAVIGIGLMIASFRASVAGWLESSVSADFYVSAVQGADVALDDVLAKRIAALPGVRGVSRTRRAKLPLAAGVLHVWGIDAGTTGWQPRLLRGDTVTAWRLLEAGEVVLVSESFAARHGTRVGDSLRLPGRRDAREWPVAGVFVDYTTDQGLVAMSLGAYRRQFGDGTLSGLGIVLEPGTVPQAVRDGIADLTGAGRNGLRVASNREIRSASLEIFERTFRITGVLRLLAGLVALLGIYSALQSLALERRREMAVLRAIGFAPAQVRRHVMAQTALLGLTAAAVALPLSIALAWILVHVINERAFGWSMDLEVSAPILWQGIALALGAALLAGLRPALTLARGQPAAALREE
jgi:putative ABC transport system permease protein